MKTPVPLPQSEFPARYRAMFESAPDFAIIATHTNGLITDWKTGAELIFGWTADEMQGQSAERSFTREDRELGQDEFEMQAARATGRGNENAGNFARTAAGSGPAAR